MTKSHIYHMPSIKAINARAKRYTGASFFSGCGGSSTGHKMAGINILYANEFIPAAQDTYALNAPKTYLDRRDIREVMVADVLKRLGLKRGELDLLDGSPPCKSFSTAGEGSKNWGESKHYSDGVHQRTDDLFLEFIRMLKGIMPKVFVAENVPGLAHGKAKGMFLEIMRDFEACGYTVRAQVLDASLLGVPQARHRLIFVGVRNDLVAAGLKPVFPMPLKTDRPTVRDFLPHITAIKGKKGDILTYIPSDVPSPTITASDSQNSETASFSCGGFVETKDGKRRKYKINELKKICAFPDDFQFTGTYEQQFERMGRAVPPLMMAHITREIVTHILEPFYARKLKNKLPKAEPEPVKKTKKAEPEVPAKKAKTQGVKDPEKIKAAKSKAKDKTKK